MVSIGECDANDDCHEGAEAFIEFSMTRIGRHSDTPRMQEELQQVRQLRRCDCWLFKAKNKVPTYFFPGKLMSFRDYWSLLSALLSGFLEDLIREKAYVFLQSISLKNLSRDMACRYSEAPRM